jgi:hypothetical protein
MRKHLLPMTALMLALAAPGAHAANELYCKRVAPLLVAKWQAEGRPADMVLRHGDGFTLVSIRQAGSLISISMQGNFNGTIEDGGADGVVDKTTGKIWNNYDSSRHPPRGNFSTAQGVYEAECRAIWPALQPSG